MKSLILAEKPSVGKDIARVLGIKKGQNGYFEGDRHIVTWALGHLVTLADPEAYGEKYKAWNLDHLPIMPQKLELVVIKQTGKQFHTVRELLYRKDVESVIIATDAGREGELVARWILEKTGCRKPVKRLWISSVTDKAIREGFNSLKDGRLYENLADSARARAEADWLVGINATRCLTTKHNASLSCGRVQTPTVSIISKREEEIRNFRPKKYYGIEARAQGFKFLWRDKKGNSSVFDKETVDSALNRLNTGSVTVVEVTEKPGFKKSAPLYDLTELQRDASNRYGFSPKETLSLMQTLYERYKALTYPRTDSRYLTTDIVPTIPDRLKALSSIRRLSVFTTRLLRQTIKADSNFVDNAKVSDHHAIIPTEEIPNYAAFSDQEKKIYDLVVNRFIAVMLPPCKFVTTTVQGEANGETFVVSGCRIEEKGYTEITSGDEDEEEKQEHLPKLKRGDKIPVRFAITEGLTKPPSPFNEAALLSAMENPVKYMDSSNKAIADTLGQTGGLGTVATRADIIEKLFDSFLIEKKGKDIFITSKGRQLLNLVPVDLKSPELTGVWEQKLKKISDGKMKKDEFVREIREYAMKVTNEIKGSKAVFRHDNVTGKKCPQCGKNMLEVNGKKGKMLVCQDRECNYRENLSMSIRSRCPVCNKFVEIVGNGDNRRVVCVCGHTEKYENFQKRKQEEKNRMGKAELQSYLNQMNKEADKNPDNPFAALKDMKF